MRSLTRTGFVKAFDTQAADGVDRASRATEAVLDGMLDELKKNAVIFASRPDAAAAVEQQILRLLSHNGAARASAA